MMIFSVMTLMLITGITFTQNSYKASRAVKDNSQVYNVARAGLTDAINWFKRQETQPVTRFAPAYNPDVPTRGDTNDPYLIDPGQSGGKLYQGQPGGGPNDKPHLGIVQEFQLDAAQNLWARYEVGKITRLTRGTDGKLTEYSIMERNGGSTNWDAKTVPNARSNDWEGVQDVSANYGINADGIVWRIRSHGYIYRKDPGAPEGTRFYQTPNQVVSQIELETEIRRLQLKDYLVALHANGGLNASGSDTSITFSDGNKVRIKAPSGYAVGYRDPPISPNSAPNSFESGLGDKYKQFSSNSLTFSEMFGVSDAQALSALADSSLSSVSELPKIMPSMSLIYLKPTTGTATFTNTRPLNGGGIFVVDGNLTLERGSASAFNGVIYVTGNYTQIGTSAISGQVVVRGNTAVSSPSDTANIDYNPDTLNQVRRQLGQYRERQAGAQVSELE